MVCDGRPTSEPACSKLLLAYVQRVESAPGLMSDPVTIAVITAGLLAFALFSGHLRDTVFTPPLVFITFGLIVGAGGFGIADVDPEHSSIHLIAEFTLILVLFIDAARINLRRVREDHNLPLRMLIIGLPLTILAGTLVALGLLPDLSIWEAALLAALLAPTDAALGQSVVSATAVPVRIRQAINIESGLNDGIALPAVLLFASLSIGQTGAETASWIGFVVLQLTLGPASGAVVGFVGARLLDIAIERGSVNPAYQGIGILALAVFIYVATELIGGNGFIAAFIGGMVFGNTLRHPCTFLFEFMESEGQLLVLITFMLFGAALLPEALAHIDSAIILYAVLSLTVIRIVPIALSLLGAGLRTRTVLFLGWFGPRGLASILFVLLILEEAQVPHREELLSITVITVALSALAHGMSAAPFARRYGSRAAQMGECEENKHVAEMPLREGTPKLPREI